MTDHSIENYHPNDDDEEDEDERIKGLSDDKLFKEANNKIKSSSSKSISTVNHNSSTFSCSSNESGGIRSQPIDYLTHPLDRSIALVFILTVFFTLLALLTGAPIVLILFSILPPILIIKRCCACQLLPFSRTSYSKKYQKLQPIDSYWLKPEHITHCLLYIDKGFSVEQLRDVIVSRILSRPEMVRFKSQISFKGCSRTPFWSLVSSSNDDPFKFIENHVIEDEPIQNKKSLQMRLMQFMSNPLPFDKPLWQIRWAHASYCNQIILIVRIHQSLCDGVGLVSILVQHLSDSPPTTIMPFKPRFGGSTMPINIFRAVIVGPLTFLLWIIWSFTRRNHNYLKKSRNKSFKSIHWSSYDLPKVIRIKQVTRSSLNDVIVSALSGAMRTYLTSKSNVFNPPNLNISIPIDIRPTNNYDPTVGVNFVLVTSPIPTNTEGRFSNLMKSCFVVY